MNYKLVNSNQDDIDALIKYKLRSILDYASSICEEEKERINNYVVNNIPNDLANYKNIIVDNNIVGCLLIKEKDDGIIIDEIYLEDQYRHKGIGTNIIKEILNDYPVVYLWVYKENINAINLYKKLGFNVLEETETRFFMKYIENKK